MRESDGAGLLVPDTRYQQEPLACSYLTLTVLLGLVANAIASWWWADPVAALAMVPLIVNEGIEALKGERCDSCG